MNLVNYLDKWERETTTLSTDGDDLVTINTAQRRYITKLRNHPSFTEVRSGFYGTTEWAEFTIPSEDWNPASGAKRRVVLSEADREARSDRMREMRLSREHAHINGSSPVAPSTGETL